MEFNLSISNITNSINPDCHITWNQAIIQYCHEWKGYLIGYDFYIGCCWVYIIAGLISPIWNVKYKKDILLELRNGKTIKLNFDFELMHFIQNVAIITLMIRIFQIYYISKLYLGG